MIKWRRYRANRHQQIPRTQILENTGRKSIWTSMCRINMGFVAIQSIITACKEIILPGFVHSLLLSQQSI